LLTTTIVKFNKKQVISFTSLILILDSLLYCLQSFFWSSLLRQVVRAAQNKSSKIVWLSCAIFILYCQSKQYSIAITNRLNVRDNCNRITRKILIMQANNTSKDLLC